jgi:hypothetical protein
MSIKIKGFIIDSKENIDLKMNIIEDEKKDLIKLSVKYNNKIISSCEEFCFLAFQNLRKKLIESGIDLKCYGAKENVYPSPLMMFTSKAYFLKLGKQAKNNDIVDIFDFVEINKSIAPKNQDLFYELWVKNL